MPRRPVRESRSRAGACLKLLTGLLDLDVDWAKWDVFFADANDACPSITSHDSQLQGLPGGPLVQQNQRRETDHTHPTHFVLAPAQAAEKYGDANSIAAGRRFDLCLPGMGPGGPHRLVVPRACICSGKPDGSVARCILDSPKPPSERVTFTLSALQNSVRVCFVATGDLALQAGNTPSKEGGQARLRLPCSSISGGLGAVPADGARCVLGLGGGRGARAQYLADLPFYGSLAPFASRGDGVRGKHCRSRGPRGRPGPASWR